MFCSYKFTVDGLEAASKDWDLAPRLKIADAGDYDNTNKQSKGFGREVQKLLLKKKASKRKKRG